MVAINGLPAIYTIIVGGDIVVGYSQNHCANSNVFMLIVVEAPEITGFGWASRPVINTTLYVCASAIPLSIEIKATRHRRGRIILNLVLKLFPLTVL